MDKLGLPGNLQLRSLATYVKRMIRTDIAGTTLVTVDYAGSSLQGGTPRWNGTFQANYDNGNFALGAQMRWFSTFLYDPRLIGPDDSRYNPASIDSINRNSFPAIPYFSLNTSYRFEVDGHPLQVYGVVNNLLDAEPPVLAVAALSSGGNPYDYIGRSFKMGVRFSW